MKVYPRPEEGLADAIRLARGMTEKWAAMDFPFGGGKSVLAVPQPLEGEARRGLLRRFGELLNSLGGRYGTGADLGTTTDDMRTIAEVSPYVIGVHGRSEGPMDPSPFTALGVFEGIRAALRHLGEPDAPRSAHVLVEGVGAVGRPLVERLAAAGARVTVSDMDRTRAESVGAETGATVVAPDQVAGTACDVYAPCAVGGTLSRETIPRLRCRIVAGAANNQLAEPGDAVRLQERGILYAPDFVVNGGGAMAFTLIYRGLDRVEELEARVRGIGARLAATFDEAERTKTTPLEAARAHVQRVLERGPRSGRSPSFEDIRASYEG